MAFELLIKFVDPDPAVRRAVKRRVVDYLEANGRDDYVEGVLDGVEDPLTMDELADGVTADDRFDDLPLALFDDSESRLSNLRDGLYQNYAADIRADIHHISDDSWQKCWNSEFTELRTSRFFIAPLGSPAVTPDSLTRIEINAGNGAFGTGQHATTRAILSDLETNWPRWKPRSVLDVGTGTGIYLIVSGHLGARRLAGTEISADLVALANENLETAGFSGEIALADCPVFEGEFDLIIANILVPVLHELLPRVVSMLSQDGRLMLAGFVAKERVPLIEKAGKSGLMVESVSHDSDWECVVLRKGRS